MILSDTTIRNRIEEGDIVVTPEPTEEQFQPASLDVRMGDQVYHPESDLYEDCDDVVRVFPDDPILCTTLDEVQLPNDVAAQLTGRSSVGRRGVIIHKTAGWIDPGFRGNITLEVYNFSDEVQTFEVGERVGQLVFFQLDRASTGYDGQYQDQVAPTR